jgi:hypothetical protein
MIQSAMRVIGVRHRRRLSSSYNLLLHFKLGKLEPKSGMFIGWYSQNTYYLCFDDCKYTNGTRGPKASNRVLSVNNFLL